MVDNLDHCLTFAIPSAGGVDNACNGDTNDNNLQSLYSYPLTIHLHQAITLDTNQGEHETNTGFVMWPAAVMLAHYLNSHPILVLSDTTSGVQGNIMELGSGCGLAGLTAARMLDEHSLRIQQQSSSSSAALVALAASSVHNANADSVNISNDRVIFTDYNPACLVNLRRNMLLNKLNSIHEVLGLDWFDQTQTTLQELSEGIDSSSSRSNNNNNTWIDMDGVLHSQCRLIIGADLIVCSNDASLVASTINRTLLQGGQAIILGADKYTRFGVCSFPKACRDLGLLVTIHEDMLESRNNDTMDEIANTQLLMDTLEVGGYHRGSQSYGYDFTLFTINKPIALPVA